MIKCIQYAYSPALISTKHKLNGGPPVDKTDLSDYSIGCESRRLTSAARTYYNTDRIIRLLELSELSFIT
jgi:hypothetical protein